MTLEILSAQSDVPPIAIIGFGAVGSAIAWKLQQAGLGFSCFGKGGALTETHEIQVGHQSFQIKPSVPMTGFALVFIAVRANELDQALILSSAIGASGSAVVSLCNGLVEHRLLMHQRIHPHQNLRAGSVSLGVSRVADGRFRLNSTNGGLIWGPIDVSADQQPTAMETKIFENVADCRWDPEAIWVCRRKWLVSSVLNSICAIYNLDCNGEALKSQTELRNLFDEVFNLGLEIFGNWKWHANELWNYLLQIIQDTSANTNSMVRDLRAGRNTEVEYTLGVIGNRFGYPLIASTYKTIKRLEAH